MPQILDTQALKCKDANLDQKTITVSATFSDNIYRQKRKGRKSKSVTIPIHHEMFGYIKDRVENNLQEMYIFVLPPASMTLSNAFEILDGCHTGRRIKGIFLPVKNKFQLS